MISLTDRDSFKIAVICYGVSLLYSVLMWRRGFRKDDHWNYGIYLAAFCFHTLAMVKRGFSLERCPINNLYEATSFVGWTVVLAYLGLGLWSRLRFIGAFASPLMFSMGVFALMPDLDRPSVEPQFTGAFPSLHAAMILLSYGTFGLASISALMYLSVEHDLKFDKFRAVLSRLPSVQRLDGVTCYCLTAGLALLTVGLGMGAILLNRETGSYWSADPKIVWSLFVWVMYTGLLAVRQRLGFSGKHFAQASVGGFVFLLLTFWGFNLISSVHNPE